MKRFKQVLFLYAAATVLLVGCAAHRNVRIAPLYADDPIWQTLTPKKPETVLVTEGDLKRTYRPIATIYIDSVGTDLNLSFERMRDEGAKIGADAVIKIAVHSQYEGQNESTNLYTGKTSHYGPRNRHYLAGTAVIYSESTSK